MQNSNELRKKLHAELKQYRGSLSEVARKRGCTRDWVRKVLIYNLNDDSVVELAISVLEDRKAKRQSIDERIAQVIES